MKLLVNQLLVLTILLIVNASPAKAVEIGGPLSAQDRARIQEVAKQNAIKYGVNGAPGTATTTKATKAANLPKSAPTKATSSQKICSISEFAPKSDGGKWAQRLGYSLDPLTSFMIDVVHLLTTCVNPATTLLNISGKLVIPQDATQKTALNISSKLVIPQDATKETPVASLKKIETAESEWNKGFDIWISTQDYQKAAVYYKKSLELDPNYPPALSSYGYLLGAFYDRPEEGITMIKKAMELDPNWAYAPFNLGLVYSINGDDKNGLYWLQYTVDHFPNHPDISHFREYLNGVKNGPPQ